MGRGKDTGADVYSEDLGAALKRGYALSRRWYMAGATPRLEMDLMREVQPAHWRGASKSYAGGEVQTLTQEIVARDLAELARYVLEQERP